MKKTIFIIISTFIFFACSVNEEIIKDQEKSVNIEDSNKVVSSFDNRSYPTMAMQIFSIAEIYRINGNYSGAILEYQEALKYDTNSVTIYNSIGDAFLNLYKYDNAIDYYAKSLRLDSTQYDLKNKLAEIYLVSGNVQNSIDLWKELIENKPKYYDAYYNLINAFIAKKDTTNAKKVLKIYQQRGSNDISILNNVVIILKKLGQYDEAIFLTKRLIKLSNENKYYDLLIELLYINRQENKVNKVTSKWIQADPTELTPYYYKISNYIESEKIDSAKKYLKKIDSRWKEKWWISNFQALINIKEELADSVKFYYDRVFSFDNIPSIPYNNYALWLLENKKYNDGIAIIDSALKVFPENNNLKYIEALIYGEMKDRQKAIQIFEMLRSENKNDKDILHNLAILYDQNSQYDKSDKIYEKIIKIDTNDAIAYNNYSYSLAEKGEELQKALQMSKRSLQLEPQNGTYYDTLAWILFKLGDYQKALAKIDSAINLTKEMNSEIYYHKGEILLKLNHKNESKKYFKQALEIDPSFSLAKERLEEINK